MPVLTMADGYEELVAEVDRIVNSPYPTQLKVGIGIKTTPKFESADHF